MKLFTLLVTCITALSLARSTIAETCLERQVGDSYQFGDTLVANKQYLAVGDPGANRVVIYQRINSQKWERVRVISPPKDSTIYAIGNGFGYRLAITENTLVIGAYASKQNPQGKDLMLYPFQPSGSSGVAHTGAVYKTSIISSTSLQRLDRPQARELSGFSVAADAGKIAFGVSKYNGQNQESNFTALLSGSNRRILPFSGEIALHNNRLVIGSNMNQKQGQIAIFDLTKSPATPELVRTPLKSISAIELTDKFVIASEYRYLISTSRETAAAKILVLSLSNRTSHLLASPGNISAHENLLVQSYPTTSDSEISGKINLFDLSSSPPKLLNTSNTNIHQSFLTKDFLFKTVNRNTSGGSDVIICIASPTQYSN